MSAILERLAGLLAFESSTALTKKQQGPYSQKDNGNAEGKTRSRKRP